MQESFGARLRAHREQRGIALIDISNDTKIKLSLLEALERDEVTYWPQGIFRRAYIRSYAQALGLDPAPVVREFLELYPDPLEVEQEPAPEPNGLRRAVALLSALKQPPSLSELQQSHRNAARLQPKPEPIAIAIAEPEPVVEPESVLDFEPEPEPVLEPDPEPVAPTYGRTFEPSHLQALAPLCSRIARVGGWDELTCVLGDAAVLLDAVGLSIWIWDGRVGALRPAWAHGYADAVVARMPRVRSDADNAIAAAWRDERICVVGGEAGATGAVVVPMVNGSGCIGVLAIELPDAREQAGELHAIAAIVAAQLTSVLGAVPVAEAATA